MFVKYEPASAGAHTKLEQFGDNPFYEDLLNISRFVPNARKTDAKTDSISENQLFKWSQLHLDTPVIDKKLITETEPRRPTSSSWTA